MLHLCIILVSILTSSYGVFLLRRYIQNGHQVYPDFVPGLLAFDDYFKSGEQRLFLCGLLIFAVIYLVLDLLVRRLSIFSKFSTDKSYSSATQISLVFVGAVLARVMFIGSLQSGEIIAIIGSLSFAALVRWGPTAARNIWLSVLLSVVFSYFAILAVIGTLEVYASGRFITPETAWNISVWGALSIGLLSSMIALWRGSFPALTTHIPQLLLPLLCLRFLKVSFIKENQNYPIVATTSGTVVVLLMVFILVLIALRSSRETRDNPQAVFTSSLFSLAFFFGYGFPPLSPFSADDFHLGEMTLPWQQIVQLGQAQYSEFVSIQGVLGLAVGLCNKLIFGGTLASFLFSGTMLYALLNAISAVLLARVIGPLFTLMLVPLLMPFADRIQLALIGFLILLQPELMKSSIRWCLASVVVVLSAVLWNPSSGVALGAALSPLGITHLFGIYKSRGIGTFSLTIISILAIFILALFCLPIAGVYQFIVENGITNTVAHASTLLGDGSVNPYFPRYFSGNKANRIAWECIRIGGWLFGVCVLYSIAINVWRDKRHALNFEAMMVALGGILFALALFPYTMGRIDAPAYLSRAGAMSMLELAFFVPLALGLVYKNRGTVTLPSLLIGFLVGIPLWEHSYSLERFAANAATEIDVPAEFRFIDGAKESLPAIGSVFITDDKLREIKSLKATLSEIIKPDETYFDLTNRSLFYRAFNLKFPSPYPSVHSVNYLIQDRIVKRLEKEQPAACFIYPAMEIDKTSAALRSYKLYRWFIRNGYRLFEKNGFAFLVRPDRFEELFPGSHQSRSELDRLAEIFLHTSLDKVPLAWGKSLSTLLPLVNSRDISFVRENPVGAQKLDEGWYQLNERIASFDLSLEKPLSGEKADYLLLNFERMTPGKGKLALVVHYRGAGDDFDKKRSYKMYVAPGASVLPVGADPRWLLGSITDLRVEFLSEIRGARWRLRSIKALEIK